MKTCQFCHTPILTGNRRIYCGIACTRLASQHLYRERRRQGIPLKPKSAAWHKAVEVSIDRSYVVEYATVTRDAKRRKKGPLNYGLSLDQFRDIVCRPCHYCGQPPSLKMRRGPYFRNTVDRRDSTKGYSPDNCVPACWKCNRLKSIFGETDFLDTVCRIETFQAAHRRRNSSGPMTLQERIDNYTATTGYPQSLFICAEKWIVGTFIMGQDYRTKSDLYGSYPAGFLKRMQALFPDKKDVLHLFSGNVNTSIMPGETVDINPARNPNYVDDAQTLTNVPLEKYDLVMADPPYSIEDCERYQTTMVKRNVVMAALGRRLTAGAHVVWLDQVLPMYRSDQWVIVAVIGMVKSTNHRFRVITIFERRPHLTADTPTDILRKGAIKFVAQLLT